MTTVGHSDSLRRDGWRLMEAPLRPGTLLWARFDEESNFWPAMVTEPTDKSSELNRSLVLFLGFEYCGKWLPTSTLMPFAGFTDFCKLKESSPLSERFKFEPAEELAEMFSIAVNLAEALLPLQFQRRLSMFRIDLRQLLDAPFPRAKRRSTQRLPAADGALVKRSPLQVGNLVWAQMSKYPFWPAVVVHSYEGSFCKYTFVPSEVYCQFIGWNNAGAWVKRILPWNAIGEIESKPSLTANERRLWRPTGKIGRKWQLAKSEADELFKKHGTNLLPVSEESIPDGWFVAFHLGEKRFFDKNLARFSSLPRAFRNVT